MCLCNHEGHCKCCKFIYKYSAHAPSPGDRPTLIRCQELGIVSKLASEWYTFAVYLGLEDEADQIDYNYRFVQEKCKQVITLWLKGSGKKHSKDPINWETMRSVVEKIYPAFAEELAEEIN